MKVALIPLPTAAWDPSKPIRPVCQHDVKPETDHAKHYRIEAHQKGLRRHALTDRPGQCTFAAVVTIDGVPMCRRHAGQLALDHLLEHGCTGK